MNHWTCNKYALTWVHLFMRHLVASLDERDELACHLYPLLENLHGMPSTSQGEVELLAE
jgi:hypothetical protein